jgi:hypothetical protein
MKGDNMLNADEARAVVKSHNTSSPEDIEEFIHHVGNIIEANAKIGKSSCTIVVGTLSSLEKMFASYEALDAVRRAFMTIYKFTVELEHQENIRESVLRISW